MELAAHTIAVYCREALAGMDRTLQRFDDETVNIRPHGAQTNSAAALIVHSCAAARYWFEHIGIGRHVDRDREFEFEVESTISELKILIESTTERLAALATELDAGPSATDHELRTLLHEGDTSDGSLVLHALEELFQHLGHLELTADAVGTAAV